MAINYDDSAEVKCSILSFKWYTYLLERAFGYYGYSNLYYILNNVIMEDSAQD